MILALLPTACCVFSQEQAAGEPRWPPNRSHYVCSETRWSAGSRRAAVVDSSVSKRAFVLLAAARSGEVIEHRLPWSAASEVECPASRDFTIRWIGRGIVVEHGGETHSIAAP